MAAGTEDFFADDGRALWQTSPDGRLHKMTMGISAAHAGLTTTCDDICTFGFGFLVVRQYLGFMLCRDQRTHAYTGHVRWANLQCLRFFFQCIDEFFEDGALYIYPFGAKTYLTTIFKRGARDTGDRFVEICIREYDGCIFSAEFK